MTASEDDRPTVADIDAALSASPNRAPLDGQGAVGAGEQFEQAIDRFEKAVRAFYASGNWDHGRNTAAVTEHSLARAALLGAWTEQQRQLDEMAEQLINVVRGLKSDGATILDFYATWLTQERDTNRRLSSQLAALSTGGAAGRQDGETVEGVVHENNGRFVIVPDDWPLFAQVTVSLRRAE